MSILKEFYDGEIAPVEKIIQPEMKYRPLAKAIGDGSILKINFPKKTG